ncbi:hypothetical protein BJ170DRAFT_312454 [Xylariales sp. AK1849]|nr:hypothetical protein BJ170DRAFT_312454 [Xylariales sp. AK1849]
MTEEVQRKTARAHREALAEMMKKKKIDAGAGDVKELDGEGSMGESGLGIRLALVPNMGHQVQNDVRWEIGARKLLAFFEAALRSFWSCLAFGDLDIWRCRGCFAGVSENALVFHAALGSFFPTACLYVYQI